VSKNNEFQSGSRGFFSPSPHTTRHAGPKKTMASEEDNEEDILPISYGNITESRPKIIFSNIVPLESDAEQNQLVT